MSRIQATFEALRAQGKTAFIPFITAGDPNIDATERFVLGMAEAGADIIEIGVPFSDPAADGPVIIRANVRAMETGANIHTTFEMLTRVRAKTQVPLVFLLYANIIYNYGIPAFFAKCAQVGMDGVIIGDVPIEEEDEFGPHAAANGIDLIRLISPTSALRTEQICDGAQGFLYCVSSMGVTGVRDNVGAYLGKMFERIGQFSKIPTAIGFGIGTPEQAKAAACYANGVIVGSAMVRLIEEHGERAFEPLCDFVRDMRAALDSAPGN